MAEQEKNKPPTTSESTPPENSDSGAMNLNVVNGGKANMGMVLDIPLRLSVELGRAKILVQDLLKLHKGSVLELEKLAGEPLEIIVNDKVIARGEVVVVNEKFGIRLTDVISHTQRIRQLGG